MREKVTNIAQRVSVIASSHPTLLLVSSQLTKEVEAESFVPQVWALGANRASSATGYSERVAGFRFGERESERGKEMMGPG